ncbi:MAG: hypothetical protein LBQ87_08275 [Candidatus Fibromonas sp.]|jgi:hypothetical protein|nr:hypothetical protein [Candidatus Fibromonas sp.]
MNKTSIATVFAAILLTATLASAQTPNTIIFSVTINNTANMTVVNNNLSGAALTRATGSTGTLDPTELTASTKLAGVIDVEINAAKWDVTLNFANKGILKNGTKNLKVASGTAATLSDATLKVAVCHSPTESTTPCIPTGLTSAIITAGTPAAGSGMVNPATANFSLASALGKATTLFGSGDTGTDNKAHFGIYAIIPFTLGDLTGDTGTYNETVTVTLAPKYQ